jgi:hypothetical protein
VNIIDVPEHVWDRMVEAVKSVWIPNPNDVICKTSKVDYQIWVIGIGEHVENVSGCINRALILEQEKVWSHLWS